MEKLNKTVTELFAKIQPAQKALDEYITEVKLDAIYSGGVFKAKPSGEAVIENAIKEIEAAQAALGYAKNENSPEYYCVICDPREEMVPPIVDPSEGKTKEDLDFNVTLKSKEEKKILLI
jgi:hypothetical protein